MQTDWATPKQNQTHGQIKPDTTDVTLGPEQIQTRPDIIQNKTKSESEPNTSNYNIRQI